MLVVDDDDAIRTLLVLLLVRAGYDVDQASDGDAALVKLRLRRFHTLVLDLMMRLKSGFEVLDYLDANDDAGSPSIVLVTAAGPRDLRSIRSPLVRCVLRKPFDINELLDAVRKCTRGDEES